MKSWLKPCARGLFNWKDGGGAGEAKSAPAKLPSTTLLSVPSSFLLYPRVLQLHTLMSRASKLTLAGVSLGAVAIVAAVHYQQVYDKAVRPHLTDRE